MARSRVFCCEAPRASRCIRLGCVSRCGELDEGLITRRATVYLPAIDGLRALAIAAVFIYHAHGDWLPGGYLGVDLFFAISGFLITRGLLQEHGEQGAIDLRRFWIRRARRLLPAAFLFVFVVIAAAQVFFPGDLRALRGVALAGVGYATNWYLILSQQSYFETVGRPQLLQHLWSLAVEEQFYVIWPLVIAGVLRFASRSVAFAATALLGLASVVWMAMLYHGGADASRLYYGTDTHAVGLLAGAALAFVEPAWRRLEGPRARIVVQATGLLALGALGFLFAWLAEWRPFLYQGGFLVTALVSLALIVPACLAGRFAAGIGCAPLRWIGVRSYGIYLWHPALLALLNAAEINVPRSAVATLAAVATLVVADLSYRYVETPIRTGAVRDFLEEFRQLRPDTRWAAIATSSAAVIVVVLGAVVAPPSVPPTYLSVSAVSGVRTNASVEAPGGAPSWVTPRTNAGGSSAAEPVSRAGVQVYSPTPGITVRSASTATPTPAPTLITEQTPTPTAEPSEDTPPSVEATPAPRPAAALPVIDAPVLAVGDSVMVGAADGLAEAFGTIEVDAAIGRDAVTMLRLLRERRAANRLPSTVVVQIGNNGPLTRPQVEELMHVLATVRRVVIIDLRVSQPWESANNTMLSDAVSRYSNARLVTWHAASDQHPDLFWDGIHLKPSGVDLYVSLITAKVQ